MLKEETLFVRDKRLDWKRCC